LYPPGGAPYCCCIGCWLPLWGSWLFLFLCRKKNHKAPPMMARPATPPTTPPAIAPVFDLEDFELPVLVAELLLAAVGDEPLFTVAGLVGALDTVAPPSDVADVRGVGVSAKGLKVLSDSPSYEVAAGTGMVFSSELHQ
jgi:hypothetical protein